MLGMCLFLRVLFNKLSVELRRENGQKIVNNLEMRGLILGKIPALTWNDWEKPRTLNASNKLYYLRHISIVYAKRYCKWKSECAEGV